MARPTCIVKVLVAMVLAIACARPQPRVAAPPVAAAPSAPSTPHDPGCDAAVTRANDVARRSSGARDDADREVVDDYLASREPELRQRCERRWTVDYRICVVEAGSEADLRRCDRAAREAAGVDMSGPDCRDVASRLRELTIAAGAPESAGKQSFAVLYGACEDSGFSRSTKECLLAAKNLDEAAVCAEAEER